MPGSRATRRSKHDHSGHVHLRAPTAYTTTTDAPHCLRRENVRTPACSALCREIASAGVAEDWETIAGKLIWPHNQVAHARIRTDINRKQLVGRLQPSFNPQTMMNASIRIRVWPGSTCILLLFGNGATNIDGARSMEEAIRTIHAVREYIYARGGTFVEVSGLHLTNGVYNVRMRATPAAADGSSTAGASVSSDLVDVYEMNKNVVDRDQRFPGIRYTSPKTGIKTKLFHAGDDGTMNAVQMGVTDPSLVAFQNDEIAELIESSRRAAASIRDAAAKAL